MKFKVKTQRRTGSRLLLLESDKNDQIDYVDAERLSRGDIDVFLRFSSEQTGNICLLSYSLDRCISLQELLGEAFPAMRLRALLVSFLQLLRACEVERLSRLRVLYELERVYFDPGANALRFAYVPLRGMSPHSSENDMLVAICEQAKVPASDGVLRAAVLDYAKRTPVLTATAFERFLSTQGISLDGLRREADAVALSTDELDERAVHGFDFVGDSMRRRQSASVRHAPRAQEEASRGESSGDTGSVRGATASGGARNGSGALGGGVRNASGGAGADPGEVSFALVRVSNGQKYRLKCGEFLIGRAPECDISLPDAIGLSRRHATLTNNGRNLVVCDLHSTNGVLVNGKSIASDRPFCLISGDCITLGKEDFELL